VELTPGERLILRQLKDLYSSTSRREHPLGKLTDQWPAMHVEAYRAVLGSLISKNLVELDDRGRSLRITDGGMRAMDMARELAPGGLRSVGGSRPVAEKAPPAAVGALKTRRLGLVGQLIFIALSACAIALLWLVLWPR